MRGIACPAIDLPHVVLRRRNPAGTEFASFGFASASGHLALSIALLGRREGEDVATDESGGFAIDFVIHVPTGVAVWPLDTPPSLDAALRLLSALDEIPGWGRTDMHEIERDDETGSAVRAACGAWAASLRAPEAR